MVISAQIVMFLVECVMCVVGVCGGERERGEGRVVPVVRADTPLVPLDWGTTDTTTGSNRDKLLVALIKEHLLILLHHTHGVLTQLHVMHSNVAHYLVFIISKLSLA